MPEHIIDNAILDPESVDDTPAEKKDYFLSQGFVPYRLGGGHTKWAPRDRAVRDIRAYLYRHESRNPVHEIQCYYRAFRRKHNPCSSLLLALLRFIDESH